MTESLEARAKSLGIKYFLVSFSDLLGTARAKLVPTAAIAEVAHTGAGFAGFATWLDMTPADPDLFAMPDPQSMIQLPWNPEVGWVAADLWMNGEPLAQAPRNVLKASLRRAADQGFELRTGVECEYFVINASRTDVGDPDDRQQKPCYDQLALMRRYELIAEICDYMQQLGWRPYQNDHEDANGQFEMNWEYSDALTTADRHTFFKYMVKSLAEKHGLRATFMPKPFPHLTGNGCHTHISLWDHGTDTNRFYDASDSLGLSPLAYQFVGGLLHSASALCAFTNPTINSYRRIHAQPTHSGATWSPSTISYAGNNRTHMVRIPDAGRIELRLPDGAANPYLLAASLLEAGLDGIANARDPGRPMATNTYTDAAENLAALPQTLWESLQALRESEVYAAAFGRPFTTSYVKVKTDHWRSYHQQVSPWEREQTLDC